MAMKKPNVVAIMADDVGIWNLSAYHRGMRTPWRVMNFVSGVTAAGDPSFHEASLEERATANLAAR